MSRRAAVLSTLAAIPLIVTAQHRFSISPVQTTFGPSPRADHLTVVLQSGRGFLLIVHGGRDEAGAKSDTWTYFVSQNRWRLLTAPALADSAPPPPMWGAVGGYRFVDGLDFPFLYVTMGRLDSGAMTNGMWVMEFANFTWREVQLDGDLPAPRYGAVGSLERFVKPDGTVQPALIVSHGHGEKGPLSDTYKCSFSETDPYRATWRRLRSPVGQYDTRAPHPLSLQASTFTAARDLVLFGGCYSSERNGGVCPSRLSWLLKYEPEKSAANATEEGVGSEEAIDGVGFTPETDSVSWRSLPSDPAPRVGGAMAQGLNSFDGAYKNREGIAVLYSGVQRVKDLAVDHVLSAPGFDGAEIDVLSTVTGTWLKERVHYSGPQELRDKVFARRMSATLSIVRNTTKAERESDEPSEFFLLFGGQYENGSFTNALLRLSFDAFVASENVRKSGRYISRPLVHGVLMFVSWGLLMTFGTFSARYMKLANGRSRYFLLHVTVQGLALITAWTGVGIIVYGRRRTVATFAHATIGLLLISLASVQPVVAAVGILAELKSNPAERLSTAAETKVQPSFIPRACRLYHRLMGFVILLLGSVNITLGLFLLMAPSIVWIHWIVYSCLLAICMILLEVIGGRQPPEAIQTRASSLNQPRSMSRISRGNSYVGRLVRSFRGESTAAVLKRERSYLQTPDVPAEDEIPAEVEIPTSKSAEDLHIPPESDMAPGSSSQNIPASAGSLPLPLYSAEAISFEEPLAEPPNSNAVIYRERLDSGISSVYTYMDPDTY